MTSPPMTAAKDKNYDLMSAVKASLHNIWQMETFAIDAERQGDTELAEWFRKIQHNNRKAAEQGNRLLFERLTREGG